MTSNLKGKIGHVHRFTADVLRRCWSSYSSSVAFSYPYVGYNGVNVRYLIHYWKIFKPNCSALILSISFFQVLDVIYISHLWYKFDKEDMRRKLENRSFWSSTNYYCTYCGCYLKGLLSKNTIKIELCSQREHSPCVVIDECHVIVCTSYVSYRSAFGLYS